MPFARPAWPGTRGAENSFVDEICELLSQATKRGQGPEESEARLADEVRGIFERSVNEEVPSIELVRLGQLCQELYGEETSPSAFVGILALTRRLARALEKQAVGPEAVARVDLCVHAVELGLSRARLNERAHLDQTGHELIRNENDVSLGLLNSHDGDLRKLGWLAKSTARAGVLALWSAKDGGGVELQVVGSTDSRGGGLKLASSRFDVEGFPPPELVERACEEPGSLLVLLPVKTAVSDWGFLAVVGATETSLTGRETYYQWSALLSSALDHEAVTASLRKRTEDLAVSAERERGMAQAVKESEERYALAASAANDGLWDWDLFSGTIYYSSRWKQMLGYAEDAIGTSPEEWLGRVHPDDRAGLLELIGDRRRGGPGTLRARAPRPGRRRLLPLGALPWPGGARRRAAGEPFGGVAHRRDRTALARRPAASPRPLRRAHGPAQPRALPRQALPGDSPFQAPARL